MNIQPTLYECPCRPQLVSFDSNDNEELNRLLILKAGNGELLGMKKLKRMGAVSFDKALICVTENGEIRAMKILKKWGATSFDESLLLATANGDLKAMKMLKKWGATNFNDAFLVAVEWRASWYKHLELMRTLKKWGANNFEEALEIALIEKKIEGSEDSEDIEMLKKWIYIKSTKDVEVIFCTKEDIANKVFTIYRS